MAAADEPMSEDYLRGWQDAIEAVRLWHAAQAKQAQVQATRSRFPKNLEREAEIHQRAAERIVVLSPDDV